MFQDKDNESKKAGDATGHASKEARAADVKGPCQSHNNIMTEESSEAGQDVGATPRTSVLSSTEQVDPLLTTTADNDLDNDAKKENPNDSTKFVSETKHEGAQTGADEIKTAYVDDDAKKEVDHQLNQAVMDVLIKRKARRTAATEEVNLELVPGAVPAKRAPGKKHGLHHTKQDLQAKLAAMQGKYQANSISATEEVNLKLVPGAVPVKRAPRDKHGMHRTRQDLQAKLDSIQGNFRANNVADTEEANLSLMPGAVPVKRFSGKKHGLHRIAPIKNSKRSYVLCEKKSKLSHLEQM
jgi:hypothetical protein